MKFLLIASLTIFGLSASAASVDRASSFKLIYSCFNRAQLTDAPAVSVVVDAASNAQYVQIDGRGIHSILPLHFADMYVIDGNVLEGDGVRVIEKNGVEEPPARATVELKSLQLTYGCIPSARPQQ